MNRMSSTVIDVVEAAYDMSVGASEWLPNLLERGLPIMDQGLGLAGVLYGRPPEGGPVELRQVHVASGPKDFPERHGRAIAEMPPEMLRELAKPGLAATMSENAKDHPEALGLYTKHVDYCEDVLGLTAVDHVGSGAAIVAPLAKVARLSGTARERWQMLAAHVGAGHRLREGLAEGARDGLPASAEAVIDPRRFEILDATGPAQQRGAAKALRAAAQRADVARGRLRRDDPAEALELWKALVQGRWSMVDWFDADGRRFVLAVPNPPDVVDPRGLTEREMQVVAYAMFGQSNKMIAYHLGVSRPRVSYLLTTAMRKLGVRTQAELVKKMHHLRALTAPSETG